MNVCNYNHLFYFYVTAKLDGVTVASKHLNTSQSSLSTQIKTLESALGSELFKKSGRKMALTESGRELFNYCRRAFEIFEEMFDQLNKKKSAMGMRISIGVSVDIERPFITEALAKVSKQFPRGQQPLINLVSLPSSQLLQQLKIGEIDLLLTNHSGVDAELISLGEIEFPVGAFAAKDLLKSLKSKSLESALLNEETPFVLPSRLTSLRTEIDRYMGRKKVSPQCVFESNIISSVIRAANDEMGITILPRVYVARELRSEKLVSLTTKPLWKHQMTLLTSRKTLEESRNGFAVKLMQHLTNEAEQSNAVK